MSHCVQNINANASSRQQQSNETVKDKKTYILRTTYFLLTYICNESHNILQVL